MAVISREHRDGCCQEDSDSRKQLTLLNNFAPGTLLSPTLAKRRRGN
jgi:hypothetical protein